MIDLIGVGAFAAIVVSALILRRRSPKRRPSLSLPTELERALEQSDSATTWLTLAEEDRQRLADFVRLAWTGRERRRRAATVAARCSAGGDAVADWMMSNEALARTGTPRALG